MIEDDLEIKVNRELVYTESSEYLEELKTDMFLTTEERVKHYHEAKFSTNIDKNNIFLEATEIPIKYLRIMIENAEAKGANFISIDYHYDHDEYDIYGLKIERASVTQIDEDRERELYLDEAKDRSRLAELEKEVKILKKKLA